MVCLDCGKQWFCCCPACSSDEILFKTEKPTSGFDEWLKKEKHVSNPATLRISDEEWAVLWAEYIRYLDAN